MCFVWGATPQKKVFGSSRSCVIISLKIINATLQEVAGKAGRPIAWLFKKVSRMNHISDSSYFSLPLSPLARTLFASLRPLIALCVACFLKFARLKFTQSRSRLIFLGALCTTCVAARVGGWMSLAVMASDAPKPNPDIVVANTPGIKFYNDELFSQVRERAPQAEPSTHLITSRGQCGHSGSPLPPHTPTALVPLALAT